MQLEIGSILEGKVTGIIKFGAFVELPGGKTGMVHISEISTSYVNEIKDFVKEGQIVKVKVMDITPEGKVSLSMKKAVDNPPPAGRNNGGRWNRPANSKPRPDSFEWNSKKNDAGSFEDMMAKFKQSSDEKMSDLKRIMESKNGSYSRRGQAK